VFVRFAGRPHHSARPQWYIFFGLGFGLGLRYMSYIYCFLSHLTYLFIFFCIALISAGMDTWRFTIQVSSRLVSTVRGFISTQQRVIVRAQCSFPEFIHKVREKFVIPSQVDVQLYWGELEITLANFKTILSQVRVKSLTQTLKLSFDAQKWGTIFLASNDFVTKVRLMEIRSHQKCKRLGKKFGKSQHNSVPTQTNVSSSKRVGHLYSMSWIWFHCYSQNTWRQIPTIQLPPQQLTFPPPQQPTLQPPRQPSM